MISKAKIEQGVIKPAPEDVFIHSGFEAGWADCEHCGSVNRYSLKLLSQGEGVLISRIQAEHLAQVLICLQDPAVNIVDPGNLELGINMALFVGINRSEI